VFGGVVRGIWNDSIRKCRFSVHGDIPVHRGSMDGNVKEVYLVVCLAFCSELEFWVYCVEVILYVLNVCVVGVTDNQYVVYISEVFYDLVFV
jgi:hypothetical protein